jgi:protocatechuate 4,5-dioxygenase alpha subunit
MASQPLRMTVFDGSLSARGYHLNKFAKSLTSPAGRDAYAADRRGTMAAYGLSAEDMALVETQDWQGLLDRGASVYLLAKIAIAGGGTLMDIGAQMRGQSLDEFMAALQTERARRLGAA